MWKAMNSTDAASSVPGARRHFRASFLVLSLGVVCLFPEPASAEAEWEAVCPTEGWEIVGEDEGLEMKFVGTTPRKNWKKAGKPVFDREADPFPYAILVGPRGIYHTNCRIMIRYVDGKRVKGNGDFKLDPGEHSVVFGYFAGGETGTGLWEFKTVFEEGMEYGIQALVLERVIKSSRWLPVMEYRKLEDYPVSK